MLDIIIGAAIGFLSTLGILIVTNIFQQRHEERTREWQINDQNNEKLKQITFERVEQLELFSKEIVIELGNISLELIVKLSSNNIENKLEYLGKVIKELDSLLTRMPYYAAIAVYLGDEVNALMIELNDRMLQTYKMILDEIDKIRNNEKSTLKIIDIFKFSNTLDLYPRLLQSIDRLKYKPPDLINKTWGNLTALNNIFK
jgi:hypothetical protein